MYDMIGFVAGSGSIMALTGSRLQTISNYIIFVRSYELVNIAVGIKVAIVSALLSRHLFMYLCRDLAQILDFEETGELEECFPLTLRFF